MRIIDDLLHQSVIVARKWKLSRNKLKENHPRREDVRSSIDIPVAQTFGSHVRNCSDNVSRPGKAQFLTAPFKAGYPEIEKLGLSIRLHEDIGRLYIAMNHLVTVCVTQRGANLFDDPEAIQ